MQIKHLLGEEKTKEVFEFVKDKRPKHKNKKPKKQTTCDEKNEVKE